MNEFKIGDKVRYVGESRALNGEIGKVISAIGEFIDVKFDRHGSNLHERFDYFEPVFEHGEKVKVSHGGSEWVKRLYATYLAGEHYCYAGQPYVKGSLIHWEYVRRSQKTKTIEVPVSLVEEAKDWLKHKENNNIHLTTPCVFIERLCKAIGGCDE